jgi:hypothetical protein
LTASLNSSLKLQRFETTEGVQAIRTRIYVNKVAGEMYFQATDRLSLSGAAEGDQYSNDNNKVTVACFSTYKLLLKAPHLTFLANYAYQDSKVIYANSIPYWTPSKLSTSSVGMDASQEFMPGLVVEAAYLQTLQAGVLSSNVRFQCTINPIPFSEILLSYEKLGSKVYSQNTFKGLVQFRF